MKIPFLLLLSGGTYTRQPEGYVFFPPGGRIDIRGSHARCILLEME